MRRRRHAAAIAILLVVAGCGSGEPSADLTLPRDPASIAAGEELFQANCAECHGADLTGGRGPNLISRQSLDDSTIRFTIQRGRMGMPAFQERLTADEIGSIIDYVRSRQVGGLDA